MSSGSSSVGAAKIAATAASIEMLCSHWLMSARQFGQMAGRRSHARWIVSTPMSILVA